VKRRVGTTSQGGRTFCESRSSSLYGGTGVHEEEREYRSDVMEASTPKFKDACGKRGAGREERAQLRRKKRGDPPGAQRGEKGSPSACQSLKDEGQKGGGKKRTSTSRVGDVR